jgi:MFS family permease
VSERRPWLTRNLKIVSLVSLLQDAASELLYPLLPILLTTVLGAPAAVVGAVEGIAEGVAAGTKVVAGRVSDRWRKVPIVGLGYGLAALGKVLVAAAGVWPVVLVGRCVDRLGKGIRGAPRDALLVVGIAPGQRDGPSASTGRPTPLARSSVRCWRWSATSCSTTSSSRCCGWPSSRPC